MEALAKATASQLLLDLEAERLRTRIEIAATQLTRTDLEPVRILELGKGMEADRATLATLPAERQAIITALPLPRLRAAEQRLAGLLKRCRAAGIPAGPSASAERERDALIRRAAPES